MLDELISDSEESAFERASLPAGIEKRLAQVDWSVRDVMVGTVRTKEQLDFNIEKNGYYVPAKYISTDILPIKYIALHEQGLGGASEIKRYGEVLTAQKVRRGRIPVAMRKNADPNEQYFYFTVRKWEECEPPITIQDSWRGKPQFTNKFLLDNCTRSYQLFAISSEEEYRLMMEIDKAFGEMSVISSEDNNTLMYRFGSSRSIIHSDGFFVVVKDNGEVLDRISVSDFGKAPRANFNRLKKHIQ